MAAGAHWAYVELGWGGFWAWDPVENAPCCPGWPSSRSFTRPWSPSAGGLRPARRRSVAPRAGVPRLRPVAAGRVPHPVGGHGLGPRLRRGPGRRTGAAGAARDDVGGHDRAHDPSSPAGRGGACRGADPGRGGVGQQHPVAGPFVVIAFGLLYPLASGDGLVVTGRYFAVVTAPLALAVLAAIGVGPRLGRRPRPWRGRGRPFAPPGGACRRWGRRLWASTVAGRCRSP